MTDTADRIAQILRLMDDKSVAARLRPMVEVLESTSDSDHVRAIAHALREPGTEEPKSVEKLCGILAVGRPPEPQAEPTPHFGVVPLTHACPECGYSEPALREPGAERKVISVPPQPGVGAPGMFDPQAEPSNE